LSTRTTSASRRRLLAAFAAACVAPVARPEEFEGIRYDVVAPGSPSSAREAARLMLGLLGGGDIEAAARLSNAPQRRAQVLRDYMASVGEAEFTRVFAQYAAAPVSLELALGERRLLIWDLPGAERNIAAQYFIRRDRRFVMDEEPGPDRAHLQRLLRAYREGRLRPSGGTG
jgi:hypothetical protein